MNRARLIVAHPDDETLWAGGTVIAHPEWDWRIFSLTRRSDPKRSSRFHRALSYMGASGAMEDLSDVPGQKPIASDKVKRAILGLLGKERKFDLIITHGPRGEYTRHIRHEEVCSAVTDALLDGEIVSEEIWLFAYEDGGGNYLPRPEEGAELFHLPGEVWRKKRYLMEEIYGFSSESWEARANPRTESFWKFYERDRLRKWLSGAGNR